MLKKQIKDERAASIEDDLRREIEIYKQTLNDKQVAYDQLKDQFEK